MRRLGVITLVVAVAAGTAGVAIAALSPKALRASIIDAAKAKQSVHYATHEVYGNALLTITGDVATADGVQHVALKIGKQTAHVTILVSGQTAYVQGDANGLQQIQGLTKAQATQYAGQWISIPKGDKDYAQTAGDVTLGSILQSSTPHGHLTTFKAKDHGIRVIGVRATSGTGKKKQLQVLAAKAHGSRLPLEEDEFAPGEEFISRTVFGRWNESVQVQAPSSSTPISTVRGG